MLVVLAACKLPGLVGVVYLAPRLAIRVEYPTLLILCKEELHELCPWDVILDNRLQFCGKDVELPRLLGGLCLFQLFKSILDRFLNSDLLLKALILLS